MKTEILLHYCRTRNISAKNMHQTHTVKQKGVNETVLMIKKQSSNLSDIITSNNHHTKDQKLIKSGDDYELTNCDVDTSKLPEISITSKY